MAPGPFHIWGRIPVRPARSQDAWGKYTVREFSWRRELLQDPFRKRDSRLVYHRFFPLRNAWGNSKLLSQWLEVWLLVLAFLRAFLWNRFLHPVPVSPERFSGRYASPFLFRPEPFPGLPRHR